MVAQSFNRQGYTGRKIVLWDGLWVKFCFIPCTKARTNKHRMSWMENEDLFLFVKIWSKKVGESKINY